VADRVAQAGHVNRIGAAHPAGTPLLLVGDLNAQAGSEPINVLLQYWTAPEPEIFGIDWIVHRSERWQLSSVRELTSEDHPVGDALDTAHGGLGADTCDDGGDGDTLISCR
jgi:hypothetical protein